MKKLNKFEKNIKILKQRRTSQIWGGGGGSPENLDPL